MAKGMQWWAPGTAPKIKLTNRTTATKSIDAKVQVAKAHATKCDNVERMLLLKESAPPDFEPEPPPSLPTSPESKDSMPDEGLRGNEVNSGPLSCSARTTLLKIISVQIGKGLFPENGRTLSQLHERETCPFPSSTTMSHPTLASSTGTTLSRLTSLSLIHI